MERSEIEGVYRGEYGRIISTLIRLLGDFDLAEEAAQDAFAVALEQWAREGVPGNPAAWIVSVARHKAVDKLRRQGWLQERVGDIRLIEEIQRSDSAEDDQESVVPDER